MRSRRDAAALEYVGRLRVGHEIAVDARRNPRRVHHEVGDHHVERFVQPPLLLEKADCRQRELLRADDDIRVGAFDEFEQPVQKGRIERVRQQVGGGGERELIHVGRFIIDFVKQRCAFAQPRIDAGGRAAQRGADALKDIFHNNNVFSVTGAERRRQCLRRAEMPRSKGRVEDHNPGHGCTFLFRDAWCVLRGA
jgi:hypothetical protein